MFIKQLSASQLLRLEAMRLACGTYETQVRAVAKGAASPAPTTSQVLRRAEDFYVFLNEEDLDFLRRRQDERTEWSERVRDVK